MREKVESLKYVSELELIMYDFSLKCHFMRFKRETHDKWYLKDGVYYSNNQLIDIIESVNLLNEAILGEKNV